ncbi:MAG: copper-binding protein [Pseudomonadota bacterium]
MRTTHLAIAIILGVMSAPLYADMDGMHGQGESMGGMNMGDMKDQKMSGMGDQTPMTHRGQGTVSALDAAAGKIKIAHGPIQSLGWSSGMTMVFAVKDAALLKDIQPGMKVDFELEKEGNSYRIVNIAPAK